MAAAMQISSSLCCYSSIRDVCALNAARTASFANSPHKLGTAFATTGSPLLIQKSRNQRNHVCYSKSVSIRCEQSTEGTSLDVWVGRLAMAVFAAAISVEIVTGKGLLENIGLVSPLPTVALAGTALVGVLTAVLIFQSGSDK